MNTPAAVYAYTLESEQPTMTLSSLHRAGEERTVPPSATLHTLLNTAPEIVAPIRWFELSP